MQLTNLPQIYEVIITKHLEDDLDYFVKNFLLNSKNYMINSTTINHLHNTISYSLYFTDMISQTKFLTQLETSVFSYKLKGLIYTNELINNLELFING